jgi:hypothetical protein
MAEGLSLQGRRERLVGASNLTTDELRTHQAELEAQLATAEQNQIVRWQAVIPKMLALITFELRMRECDELAALDEQMIESALAGAS